MTEVWKTVVGHPDYEVSNLERVRRVTPGKGTWVGRILKPGKGSHGYLGVSLGRKNHHLVHKLMVEAFLPTEAGKKTVNHKNGVKTDNDLSNLERSNHRLNRLHALQTGLAQRPPGLAGEKNLQSKLTADNVRDIRKRRAAGESYAAIARHFGVSTSAVFQACKAGWKHVT